MNTISEVGIPYLDSSEVDIGKGYPVERCTRCDRICTEAFMRILWIERHEIYCRPDCWDAAHGYSIQGT